MLARMWPADGASDLNLLAVQPDGWLHEINGYPTQLVVEDGAARAFTRNGHDWTTKYGPIIAAANTLPCSSAIIDGEIIVQDENGIREGALRSAITTASLPDAVFRVQPAAPEWT